MPCAQPCKGASPCHKSHQWTEGWRYAKPLGGLCCGEEPQDAPAVWMSCLGRDIIILKTWWHLQGTTVKCTFLQPESWVINVIAISWFSWILGYLQHASKNKGWLERNSENKARSTCSNNLDSENRGPPMATGCWAKNRLASRSCDGFEGTADASDEDRDHFRVFWKMPVLLFSVWWYCWLMHAPLTSKQISKSMRIHQGTCIMLIQIH